MKIRVGKLLFSFVLVLFALRLLAVPAVVIENPSSSKEYINPLHHSDKSPLKVLFGEIGNTSENESENEEESKIHESQHAYLSIYNHQLASQFDPAICRHHYAESHRDLSLQSALYISFCVYRI